MIVWGLFDSENQCAKKSIGSISIGLPNADVKLDLAGNIEHIIKELEKLEKPDLILAFPPCESFSMAYQRAGRKGGNYNYIINGEELICRDSELKSEKRLNGLNCIENLLKIIEHFNVDFVIENPQTSLLWKLVKHKPYEVNVLYSWFDRNFPDKKTKLVSSFPLTFTPGKKGKSYIADSKNRSDIPDKLFKEILKQYKGWENEINH